MGSEPSHDAYRVRDASLSAGLQAPANETRCTVRATAFRYYAKPLELDESL
jgi:hypothetical protein